MKTVNRWPVAQQKRFAKDYTSASVIAFWKSDKDGAPVNGGDLKEYARPGLIQEVAGPLKICTKNALHATMYPDRWEGERIWVVALFGEVAGDNEKICALRREIIGEVPSELHRKLQWE